MVQVTGGNDSFNHGLLFAYDVMKHPTHAVANVVKASGKASSGVVRNIMLPTSHVHAL